MPTIRFLKNRPPLQVPWGSNLRTVLLEAGIPVASSCAGVAVCAQCGIRIIEGGPNLSPVNEDEEKIIPSQGASLNLRLSCQVQLRGDITIDAPYW